jgi:hypothetical protein
MSPDTDYTMRLETQHRRGARPAARRPETDERVKVTYPAHSRVA